MYSMVLAMALSGGAAAPADHHGCYGGSGCSGVVYASHGCGGGGGGHKLFGGGLFNRGGCGGGGHALFGGHGCNGGGHRLFGGHGCNGGGSACHGGGHKLFGGGHRLFGGHGCNGGGSACHGSSYGCAGSYHGSSYGCAGSGYGCSGGGMIYHHGCTGGMGCAGGAAMPAAPAKKEVAPPPAKESKGSLSRTATLIVSLPAEATLTIDGNATTSTTATRVFTTPDLDQGVDFAYTLKAEVIRDGQTVTTTKQVTVRAGQETRVALEFPTASVVQR